MDDLVERVRARLDAKRAELNEERARYATVAARLRPLSRAGAERLAATLGVLRGYPVRHPSRKTVGRVDVVVGGTTFFLPRQTGRAMASTKVYVTYGGPPAGDGADLFMSWASACEDGTVWLHREADPPTADRVLEWAAERVEKAMVADPE